MDIKKLERILEYGSSFIENLTPRPDKYGFNRTFEFDIRGMHYKIVWYKNISTFYIGEFELKFDALEVNDYYPNRFRTSLVFYQNDKITGVLPLSEYELL